MKTSLLFRATGVSLSSPRPRAAHLRNGESEVIDSAAGLRLRVIEGTLWLTQSGDSADHILTAGEIFTSTRAGRIVVESLGAFSRVSWAAVNR